MAAKPLLRILELFPGPALMVEPGGKVVEANARAAAWAGLGGDAIEGREIASLIADEPTGRLARFLEECAQGEGKASATFATTGCGGAGDCWRFEGAAVPAEYQGGLTMVLIHAVAPVADNTAAAGESISAAGGAVDAELTALREEVRQKEEFLGRLAHDLRNPVAAISGALHLARTARSPEDVAWAEDAMDRQLKHLVRRLDDLLDLSRLGRGKIELHRQRVDVAAAVRSAAAAVRSLTDERRHQITLSISPGSLAVDSDPQRLEQALVALLNHATRATEAGGRIRVSVASEPDWVVCRVRAAGPGGSVDSPRGGSEQPGPAEGPDIGLALVRRLAELHGGSVSAEALGPGGGTELTLRLPAASISAATAPRARQAGGARAAATVATPPEPSARILVVDDNVDTARGLARLLEMAGHEVRVAHDGRQAIEAAHEILPQLILLDIVLPGMDGREVARTLRADPIHRDAVIVAVSGYGEDDEARADSTDFDHHMVKPIDNQALRALIDRAIRPTAGAGSDAGSGA
ncbi:MAG: hybrid sensor histidine kinase/response regulator [Isosphaeraceae bacterium]